MEALYVVHSQGELPGGGVPWIASSSRLFRHREEPWGGGIARYALQVLSRHSSLGGASLQLHYAHSEPRMDHDNCLQIQDLSKRNCRRRTTSEPPANHKRTASETNRRRTRTTRREERGLCGFGVRRCLECNPRRPAGSTHRQACRIAQGEAVRPELGLAGSFGEVPSQVLCQRAGRVGARPGVFLTSRFRHQDFGGQI